MGGRVSSAAAIAAAALLVAGCGAGDGKPRGSSGAGARAAASGGGGQATAARGAGTGSGRPFTRLAVPAHPMARSVRVPILTYHRVHEYATELTKSQPDLTVEPAAFRAQMAALHRAGYTTVGQRQLFDALYRGGTLPKRPVIVSVDDGYVDDVTQILPVLRRYRMVATFYVITRRTHEPGFLTSRQIRELEAAGMDIGAHTRTHANLPALPATALRSEVVGSAQDLARVLGHPVYWFAYPYGAYDARVVEAVRRAGFLLAVTTNGGTRASTTAPYTIPRIHVGRSATAAGVLGLAGG